MTELRQQPETYPRSVQPGATPEQLGVGARFSLHPHCDDFVEVILGALTDLRARGLDEHLRIETDEVSSYVGAFADPAEQRLAAYLTGAVHACSRRSGGGHVVAHVLLSRGCPGEVSCDLTRTGLPVAAPVELTDTGIPAIAQWSLYPLLDSGGDSVAHVAHMAHIEAAIADAHRRGTVRATAHYATTLTGDLAEVMATAVDIWAAVGAQVPHVVSHLTVSVGSPSLRAGEDR